MALGLTIVELLDGVCVWGGGGGCQNFRFLWPTYQGGSMVISKPQ